MNPEQSGEASEFDFEAWQQNLAILYSEYLEVAHSKPAEHDPAIETEIKQKYSALVNEVATTLRTVQSDEEKTRAVDVFSGVISSGQAAMNSAGRLFGNGRHATFWEDVAIALSK